ncbi:MAG: amidase [Thermaerobacter sp.]|nr:amidase [Thermaerobacter sp.]
MTVKEIDIAYASIPELKSLYARRAVSVHEVTKSILQRISQIDPSLNTYITVCAEGALETARRLDRLERGEASGSLFGVPVGVKDLFYTKGIRTTAGSRVLEEFVPEIDATAVVELRKADGVVLGKQATHEFAYGVTTNNTHFGSTHNPWSLGAIPGGSSGGTAAAVAAGLCTVGIGTDTGGSVRIPAAACGIVGLKPTYGRVSLHGVIPLSPSLDHVGVLGRSVEDVAITLSTIAGYDPLDHYSSPVDVANYVDGLQTPVKGLRVGVPKQFFFEDISEEVAVAVQQAISDLAGQGIEVVEVSIPGLDECMVAQYAIVMAEAASWHWPLLREKGHLYSPEIRSVLEAGGILPSLHYLSAQRVRQRVVERIDQAFTQVDALVVPTLPTVAPSIGADTIDASVYGKRESVTDALIRLVCPFDQSGHPAVSVPCGWTTAGLPIGMQIVGPHWRESLILNIAHCYEQGHDWRKRRPRWPESTTA